VCIYTLVKERNSCSDEQGWVSGSASNRPALRNAVVRFHLRSEFPLFSLSIHSKSVFGLNRKKGNEILLKIEKRGVMCGFVGLLFLLPSFFQKNKKEDKTPTPKKERQKEG